MKIWSLSWPIILANISVPLMDATGTAVMGHLGNPVYIAAAALGMMMVEISFWPLAFLRMTTAGLTAQAYGAKKPQEAFNVLIRGIVTACILGLVILVSIPYIEKAVLWFMPGSSETARSLACDYFSLRALGAVAILVHYVSLGWLFGLQKTRTALAFQIYSNFLNIALSIYFTLHLGWGIKGPATAALIAETSTCVFALLTAFLVIMRQGKFFVGDQVTLAPSVLSVPRARLSGKEIFQHSKILELFSLNTDVFLRTLFLCLTFSVFTIIGSRFGENVLAANAVLTSFIGFTAYGLDGFAQVAEMLIGESVGARNFERYKLAFKQTLYWAIGFAGVYFITYVFFGKAIINLITDIPVVRNIAYEYLPWLVAMPLICVWCFHLDGVFTGATQTRPMRDTMFIAFSTYAFLLWVFSHTSFANHGLWLAFMVFMILRGVGLWLNKPQVEAVFKTPYSA